MRTFPLIPLLATLLLPAAPAWAEKGMVEITSDALIADRYQDNGDGTTTDVKTKLIWMRCSVGQTWMSGTCSGEATKFNWEDAKKQTASFAGHNDWRIPTIEELRTLVYCSNGKPDYFNMGKPGRDEYEAQGNPSDFDLGCQGEIGKDHESPTIVQSIFPNTPADVFWSSALYAGYSDDAWGMFFDDGNDDHGGHSHDGHVRLVRDSQ